MLAAVEESLVVNLLHRAAKSPPYSVKVSAVTPTSSELGHTNTPQDILLK